MRSGRNVGDVLVNVFRVHYCRCSHSVLYHTVLYYSLKDLPNVSAGTINLSLMGRPSS